MFGSKSKKETICEVSNKLLKDKAHKALLKKFIVIYFQFFESFIIVFDNAFFIAL